MYLSQTTVAVGSWRTGQGAAQNRFALTGFAPVNHHLKSVGTAGRHHLLQFQLHRIGDNTGGIVANTQHRIHQGAFFGIRRARRVLPHPDRQTVNLQKLGHIPHRIILVQIRPGQHPIQTGTRQIARGGAVDMGYPAKRLQRHAIRRTHIA